MNSNKPETYDSAASPNLVFAASFGTLPPLQADLPPAELAAAANSSNGGTAARIGLFELRHRLDQRHARPKRSSTRPWLSLMVVALVFMSSGGVIIRALSSILHSVAAFGSGYAGVLSSVVQVVSIVSTAGVYAVCLSPSFASFVHDAITPPEDEDYPLPSREQQRKYAYMQEHHECVAGTAKRCLLPVSSALLSLAVSVNGPTDAGGAPIDVDAWGDF